MREARCKLAGVGKPAGNLESNMPYKLIVNGHVKTVDVPGDTPLLWTLRDVLDLKGPKFGCGMALCGCCTVHLNGEAIRSCITPVSAVVGKRITTIEGLSADGSHPVQIAWQDIDVPQCGYCQAGQMMSASALLTKIPNPTDDQIDAAMAGNLCRCGTYMRIRKAIHHAAEIAANGSKQNQGAELIGARHSGEE